MSSYAVSSPPSGTSSYVASPPSATSSYVASPSFAAPYAGRGNVGLLTFVVARRWLPSGRACAWSCAARLDLRTAATLSPTKASTPAAMATMRPVLMPSPLVDDATGLSVLTMQVLHMDGHLACTDSRMSVSLHLPAYSAMHWSGSATPLQVAVMGGVVGTTPPLPFLAVVVAAGHSPSPGWQSVAPAHALPFFTAAAVRM